MGEKEMNPRLLWLIAATLFVIAAIGYVVRD
jgi:hypothetical protein